MNAVNDHDENSKLTRIVIKDKAPLKMFRDVPDENSNYGVLRGTAVLIDENEAYLFARGFIPRLNTSNSLLSLSAHFLNRKVRRLLRYILFTDDSFFRKKILQNVAKK